MSQLFVAALLLLASVGGLLGAASWNRGGRPQRIVLTERELGLVPGGGTGARADDAPLRLRFQWQSRDDPQEARLWLPDLTLRGLGFNTGLPAGAPEAEGFYVRSLPRVAWVAFEYDGPAWHAIALRRATFGGGAPAGDAGASRLVPIDAAVDVEVLRRRHGQSPVVIVPAILHLRYATDPRRGPSVWGTIARLVSPEVAVPPRLRARLRALEPATARAPLPGAVSGRPEEGSPASIPQPPRYEVVLGVGRLGFVWVEDMTVH